jgi:hypothetical protein
MDDCYTFAGRIWDAGRVRLGALRRLGLGGLCLIFVGLRVSAERLNAADGFRESGSFAQWQTENPLDGKNGPKDDPDGDSLVNLMEFALGMPADSGLSSSLEAQPRLLYNPVTTKFDFAYQRRADLPENVSMTLMMRGFRGYEQASALVPKVTASDHQDGFETVIYADVESDPFFQGLEQGWICLRVRLDAENAQPVEAETQLWCWRRQTLEAGGSRAFSMPLVRPDIYRGKVAVTSPSILDISPYLGAGADFVSALDRNESYYVEVMSGDFAGQRWEVDEPACSAGEIALDLTSARNTMAELPELSGMILAVRPHQTLAGVVRKDRLLGATRQAQADRLQLWDQAGNRYHEYWLSLREGNQRSWVRMGDPTYADSGRQILYPGEGMFVKVGSLSAALPLVGICREVSLIVCLEKGTHFVGSGWTFPATPSDLRMNGRQGFCANTVSSRADRLRLWNNQSQNPAALAGFYFRSFDGGQGQWVMEGDRDSMDQSEVNLLNAFEGFFLIHPGAATQWRQPAQTSQTRNVQSS